MPASPDNAAPRQESLTTTDRWLIGVAISLFLGAHGLTLHRLFVLDDHIVDMSTRIGRLEGRAGITSNATVEAYSTDCGAH